MITPIAVPRATDPDALEDACGEDPAWVCEEVFERTGGNEALAAVTDWLVGGPLTILLILFVAWIVSLVARRYVRRIVERIVVSDTTDARRRLQKIGVPADRAAEPDPRRAARAASISAVVGSTATVLIWVIAILVALGEAGIDLGPLIAGAGIAGVALGFGAQSLVKDCIAGLFMLIEDQYGIGDIVDLDEASGTVEEISLRVTVLRDIGGTVWHVPNGEVRRVGNMSQLWSVAMIDVDIAYDADIDRAREVIRETARAVRDDEDWSGRVIDEPEVLGVEVLGADAVTIRMSVKTEPGAQFDVQRVLRERIKRSLDDAGIEIPFPQRTVWVRSES